MGKKLRDFSPDIDALELKDLKEMESILVGEIQKAEDLRGNHYWMLDCIRTRIHKRGT